MKQYVPVEQMRLDCVCGEPHHFVHFGFDLKDQYFDCQLHVSFRTWNGGPVARLKKAWRLLRTGRLEAWPDVESIGIDEVEKLRDFCNQCIARHETTTKEK